MHRRQLNNTDSIGKDGDREGELGSIPSRASSLLGATYRDVRGGREKKLCHIRLLRRIIIGDRMFFFVLFFWLYFV